MQVLCKTSNISIETRCEVCGQGFSLYWERQTAVEKAEMLREVEAVLRRHHRKATGMAAHPVQGFLVPSWDGPIAFSAAKMPPMARASAF